MPTKRTKPRQRRAKPVTSQQLYILCRRMFNELIEIVKQMPRSVKYDFGLRIENTAFEMSVDVSEAYSAVDVKEKLSFLRDFGVKYTSLEMLLHIVEEKGWVRQPRRFGVVIELMSDIDSQSRAWKSSLERKREEAQACGQKEDTPEP